MIKIRSKIVGPRLLILLCCGFLVLASPVKVFSEEKKAAAVPCPKYGKLGISVQPLDKNLLDALAPGIEVKGGVLVADVMAGPAQAAGFKRADIIIRFANHELDNTKHFLELVDKAALGESIQISLIRDKKEKKIELSFPPNCKYSKINRETPKQYGIQLVGMDMVDDTAEPLRWAWRALEAGDVQALQRELLDVHGFLMNAPQFAPASLKEEMALLEKRSYEQWKKISTAKTMEDQAGLRKHLEAICFGLAQYHIAWTKTNEKHEIFGVWKSHLGLALKHLEMLYGLRGERPSAPLLQSLLIKRSIALDKESLDRQSRSEGSMAKRKDERSLAWLKHYRESYQQKRKNAQEQRVEVLKILGKELAAVR